MELSNLQSEKLTMFGNRHTFIEEDDIHTLFYGNVVVKTQIIDILDVKVLLDEGIAKKIADTSGDSPQKKAVKNLAIKILGSKARACAVYFKKNSKLDIATVLEKPKSYYDTQVDDKILSVMNEVRTILFKNELVLEPYGVDLDYFVELDEAIKNLADWLNTPSAARQGQYAGDTQIKKYIAETDELMDDLDNLVINAFEGTNPDDVAAFLATGSQTKVGVRHNKVLISMKGMPDLVGINRGKVEIVDTETGEVVRTIYMDAYGFSEFNCVNKAHYAKASADGFVSQNVLFKPLYRGSFNLDFVMVVLVP